MAVPGAGVGTAESRIDAALRMLTAPLAAGLALAGQYVVSLNSGLKSTLLPGWALVALPTPLLVRGLARRRREPGADGGQTPFEGGPGARRPPANLEWALVALVLLGGLYVRIYRIDLVPWGLNNDEAINALE